MDLKPYLKEHVLEAGSGVVEEEVTLGKSSVTRYLGEFWTSKQRQGCSLHEISYRACFKGQLPGFFIDMLSKPGDVVYDPFSGRGTTIVEAALRDRKVVSNDVNPLSRVLAEPRLKVPTLEEVESRLQEIHLEKGGSADIDLSMFYHEDTESEIVSLRKYLIAKGKAADDVDLWIRMVATNRLTGHSSGFFSVYTLPPNQAVSQISQKKINIKRDQTPEYRDTRKLILKKSKSLLRNLTLDQRASLNAAGASLMFLLHP